MSQNARASASQTQPALVLLPLFVPLCPCSPSYQGLLPSKHCSLLKPHTYILRDHGAPAPIMVLEMNTHLLRNSSPKQPHLASGVANAGPASLSPNLCHHTHSHLCCLPPHSNLLRLNIQRDNGHKVYKNTTLTHTCSNQPGKPNRKPPVTVSLLARTCS